MKQRFCAHCLAAIPDEMHKADCPAGSSCDLCGLRARVRLNLGTAGVDRWVLLCDRHASQSNPFLDYVEQARSAERVVAAAREYVEAAAPGFIHRDNARVSRAVDELHAAVRALSADAGRGAGAS